MMPNESILVELAMVFGCALVLAVTWFLVWVIGKWLAWCCAGWFEWLRTWKFAYEFFTASTGALGIAWNFSPGAPARIALFVVLVELSITRGGVPYELHSSNAPVWRE